MIARRFRAWRVLQPSEGLAGLRISPQGSIAMVDEHESMRQSILLLVSTAEGERVMRPAYGCNLHRLVFSPNDDTTAGLAIHYVRRAVQRWERRVEVLRVDAQRSDEAPELLEVTLDYRVRETRRADSMRFSFSLVGAEA